MTRRRALSFDAFSHPLRSYIPLLPPSTFVFFYTMAIRNNNRTPYDSTDLSSCRSQPTTAEGDSLNQTPPGPSAYTSAFLP